MQILRICDVLMAHSFAHLLGGLPPLRPPGRGVMFGRISGVSPGSQGKCPSGAPFPGKYLRRAKLMRSPALKSSSPVGTIRARA